MRCALCRAKSRGVTKTLCQDCYFIKEAFQRHGSHTMRRAIRQSIKDITAPPSSTSGTPHARPHPQPRQAFMDPAEDHGVVPAQRATVSSAATAAVARDDARINPVGDRSRRAQTLSPASSGQYVPSVGAGSTPKRTTPQSGMSPSITPTPGSRGEKASFLDMPTPNFTPIGSPATARAAIRKTDSVVVKRGTSSPVTVEREVVAEPEEYIAKHTFRATQPMQLSVNKGDVVVVTSKLKSGWWQATLQDGTSGWLPGSYLKPADEVLKETLASAQNTQSPPHRKGKAETKGAAQQPEKEGDSVASSPSSPSGKPKRSASVSDSHDLYVIKHPFEARREKQLSLPRRGFVFVRARKQSGWWLGDLLGNDGKTVLASGWFPAGYVTKAEDPATRTVVLRKEPGQRLGIGLTGGKDSVTGHFSIFIGQVLGNSIAGRNGQLKCGDLILSVNGASLDGRSKQEALKLLDTLDDEVTFVVRHDDAMREYLENQQQSRRASELKLNVPPAEEQQQEQEQQQGKESDGVGAEKESAVNGAPATSPSPKVEVRMRNLRSARAVSEGGRPKTVDFSMQPVQPRQKPVQEMQVLLTKDRGAPLGFGVAGGMDPSGNSKPITIRRLAPNSAAQRAGLLVKDVIQSINGVSFANSTHADAVAALKDLAQQEELEFTVQRRVRSRTRHETWSYAPSASRPRARKGKEEQLRRDEAEFERRWSQHEDSLVSRESLLEAQREAVRREKARSMSGSSLGSTATAATAASNATSPAQEVQLRTKRGRSGVDAASLSGAVLSGSTDVFSQDDDNNAEAISEEPEQASEAKAKDQKTDGPQEAALAPPTSSSPAAVEEGESKEKEDEEEAEQDASAYGFAEDGNADEGDGNEAAAKEDAPKSEEDVSTGEAESKREEDAAARTAIAVAASEASGEGEGGGVSEALKAGDVSLPTDAPPPLPESDSQDVEQGQPDDSTGQLDLTLPSDAPPPLPPVNDESEQDKEDEPVGSAEQTADQPHMREEETVEVQNEEEERDLELPAPPAIPAEAPPPLPQEEEEEEEKEEEEEAQEEKAQQQQQQQEQEHDQQHDHQQQQREQQAGEDLVAAFGRMSTGGDSAVTTSENTTSPPPTAGAGGDVDAAEKHLSNKQQRAVWWAFSKWRQYQGRSLSDELIGAASLLKEANIYSVELNKSAQFQFALTRRTEFMPGDSKDATLMIEVTDRETGERLDLWSFGRFRETLFQMQDFYHSAIGQAPPTAISDPFPSKVPWFITVGRGFVSLKNLLFNVPIEHDVTLVNNDGNVVGHMRVMIQPGQLIKDLDNQDSESGFQETNLDVNWYDILEMQDDLDEAADDTVCGALAPALCAASGGAAAKTASADSAKAASGRSDAGGTSSLVDDLICLDEESTDAAPASGDLDPLASKTKQQLSDDDADGDGDDDEDEDFELNDEFLRQRLGQKLRFVVTLLNVKGIDKRFCDVFIHFGFQYGHQESYASFSTEPQTNTGGPLNYYHAQQLCTEVTEGFIEFVKRGRLRFEALGHTSKHSLHNDSLFDGRAESPHQKDTHDTSLFEDTFDDDLRNLNQGASSSSPFGTTDVDPADYLSADVLFNTEVCELDPEGAYTAVPVRREGKPHVDEGIFCLAQGLHRRIRVTLYMCNTGSLAWESLLDMSVGAVREGKNTVPENHPSVKLNVISTERNPRGNSFTIEAGWDSSRHESMLLDRLTPARKRVFLTLTVTMLLDGYDQPATFRQDLSVRVHKERQSEGMFARFLRGNIPDCHKEVSAFQVTMVPQNAEEAPAASQDSMRKYVRGEENLGAWRPRSSSLILEHQDHVAKHLKMAEFECVKQDLALLEEVARVPTPSVDPDNRTKQQTALARRVLDMWQSEDLVQRLESNAPSAETPAQHDTTPVPESVQYYPDVKKITFSAACTKRGMLEFQRPGANPSQGHVWERHYVQICRPYVLISHSEKDPVIRDIWRLKQLTIQYSHEQAVMLGNPNTFSLCTPNFAIHAKAKSRLEVGRWLHAFDPLQAGSILSRESMRLETLGGGRSRSGSLLELSRPRSGSVLF